MSERRTLLQSIATIGADYRAGDLAAPTLEHVDRWVNQFAPDVQAPLLRELGHVLKATYFPKKRVSDFFARQIAHEKLAGASPCEFWRSAHFLNIQQNGHSQAEILELFGEALHAQCAVAIKDCGSPGGSYVYLDDVLFSGGRIGNDLSDWITRHAPAEAVIHVLVIATHRLGEYQCLKRLRKVAADAKKKIEFHIWAAVRLENRLAFRNTSEVLWPAQVPEDAALAAYMAEEEKFPFQPRQTGGKLEIQLFSSEDGRQLIEKELLMAGMRIRGFSQNPSRALRPLGFGAFGLGFGSTIVTYRNCPNDAPLALWWGDPTAATTHPFSKWYPLFQRKTYDQGVDFDQVVL
jgi:hypothetical protein